MKWSKNDEIEFDNGDKVKFQLFYNTKAEWDISTNIALKLYEYLFSKQYINHLPKKEVIKY